MLSELVLPVREGGQKAQPQRECTVEMSIEATPLEQTFAASLNRLASFSDIDARTQPVRKVHALVRQLTRDLGGDLSTAQHALVVRAATLMALCEHSEIMLLTGRNVPLNDYLGAANTLKRLLSAFGLGGCRRKSARLAIYGVKIRKRSGTSRAGGAVMSSNIPYSSATSGSQAREEMLKILRRFGCEKLGFTDDDAKQEVVLYFEHRGRPVQ